MGRHKKSELEMTLEHRDAILSIMYDLVRSCNVKNRIKLLMIKAVIDIECGNDLTPMQKELFDRFWKREF